MNHFELCRHLNIKSFKFSIIFFNILLIFVIPKIIFGQNANIIFDHLSVENGLSNSVVYSIIQDNQGYIWCGTNDKLNRYNSLKFTHFAHNPVEPKSISTNSASNIYFEDSGVLWIGTWGGGLEKHIVGTDEFVHYNKKPDEPSSLSDNRIQSIYRDSRGILWVGTYKGGLNKLNSRTGKFSHYRHDPNNPNSLSHDRIWSIGEDDMGKLLIGTSHGLNIFNPQTEQFNRFYPNTDTHKRSSLSNSIVRTIYKGLDGTIWIGTEDGLNCFDSRSKTFTKYFPYQKDPLKNTFTVNAIYEVKNGNIWVGTKRGLYEFDKKYGTFVNRFVHDPDNPTSLSSSDIRCFYEDKSGLLWIGTRGGGINKFNPRVVFSYLGNRIGSFDLPSSTGYEAVFEDSYGFLWLSKEDLFLYNRLSGDVIPFLYDKDKKPIKNILCIYEDNSGTIWLGGRNGALYKYNKDKLQFIRYKLSLEKFHTVEEHIKIMFQDSNGRFWIGTYGNGLIEFDPDSGKVKKVYTNKPDDPNSISHSEVWVIFEDIRKRLWVGTGNGLNLFDNKTGKFTKFHDGFVYSVFADQKGGLWFGSRKGLHYKFIGYKKNPEVNEITETYTVKDGLPNNLIYGILNDEKGNLWLSTEIGLSCFNPPEKTFKNFDRSDGLQGNTFVYHMFYKSKKGEMFFGGTKGITSFFPDQIKKSDSIPQIVITDFKIHEKSITSSKNISELKQIELSHREHFFSLEFAALDYAKPAKNRFAYMLEGFDNNWINIGSRNYISYTNLDSGNYVFRVKGVSSSGIWNNKGAKLVVKIAPPWWKTFLFQILFLIFTGSIILGFYVWRVQSLKLRSTQLQKEVELATAKSNMLLLQVKEGSKAKSNFLANMSHELRTPLNAIMGYAQILSKDKELDDDKKKGLEIIRQSSTQLLTMINDVLDLAKIEARKVELVISDFNLSSMLKDISDIFLLQAKQKGISFISDIASDVSDGVQGDEQKVRQILINLLSNAVKFTEKGRVAFNVKQCGNKICFKVEDTGPGIEPELLKQIFLPFQQYHKDKADEGTGLGLAISSSLALVMGGELIAQSKVGQGSTFLFEIELPGLSGFVEQKHLLSTAKVNGYRGERLKVLVVDDKKENRFLLKNTLSPLGFDMFEAVNGKDGVDKTVEISPDLILMDLKMPVMDGYEAISRIRELSISHKVIIITISASVFESDRKRSSDAGSDDFLAKPLIIEELLDLIDKHLALNWIYDDEETFALDDGYEEVADTKDIIAPGREELTTLFDLAMKGSIREIHELGDSFEEMDKRFIPFVNELKKLAGGFKIKELREFVKKYLD
ncbi:MAG: response regulator [Desulfobacterales bacterium]|nr:response regulator [Desulfobacterales bacterium]